MGNSDKMNPLSRRDFLKSSTLAAGAAAWALLPGYLQTSALPAGFSQGEVFLHAMNRLYKGTRDGQILESNDDGKTWQRIMYFGPEHAVQSLRLLHGRLQTTLSYKGLTFSLHSRDGRTWYST